MIGSIQLSVKRTSDAYELFQTLMEWVFVLYAISALLKMDLYRLFPHVMEPLDITEVGHVGRQWRNGRGKWCRNGCRKHASLRKRTFTQEIIDLREHLHRLSVKEIKSVAKSLSICLTGSSKKADIIKQLMVMAQIRATQKHHTREDVKIFDLTQDIKDVLQCLPPFSSISG